MPDEIERKVVWLVANTLIPAKLESKFRNWEKQASKVTKEETKLVSEFESSISDEAIREAFACIIKYGQPKQVIQAESLKEDYEAGNFFAPQILSLTRLYRAIGNCVSNKENDDELCTIFS